MGDLGSARRVAVLAAMVPELMPLVRELSLERIPLGDARAYRGRSGERGVVAAVTSMGTSRASEVTRRLLDAHPADHVIVIGICGGIDRRLHIGDLILPTDVMNEATSARFRPTLLGDGKASGTLMTTDILHNDPAEMDGFVRQGIVAVDMETAAIAEISEARGIPWSVFRAISDWAGDPDVDSEVVAMSKPDGTPNPSAVLRFVLRHPLRMIKLARLGAGMRLAVKKTTDCALAALAPR